VLSALARVQVTVASESKATSGFCLSDFSRMGRRSAEPFLDGQKLLVIKREQATTDNEDGWWALDYLGVYPRVRHALKSPC
jgi:hypothetical protein